MRAKIGFHDLGIVSFGLERKKRNPKKYISNLQFPSGFCMRSKHLKIVKNQENT